MGKLIREKEGHVMMAQILSNSSREMAEIKIQELQIKSAQIGKAGRRQLMPTLYRAS